MNLVDGGLKQELMLDVLRKYGSCRCKFPEPACYPRCGRDTVSIESRRLSELRVGDIVLYERSGRFFLHRLVALPAERFPGRLVTRGDSMPQADPAVRVESVLGVLATVRRGKDWKVVPGTMPRMSRLAAALLARSGGLVRLALYIASRPALSHKENRDKDWAPDVHRVFLMGTRCLRFPTLERADRDSGDRCLIKTGTRVVEIGGVAIALRTGSAKFARMVEERYAGFVTSCNLPGDSNEIGFEIELLDSVRSFDEDGDVSGRDNDLRDDDLQTMICRTAICKTTISE